MATVIIGFSKPNKCKAGASMIAWWLNRPYSHTYLMFDYVDSKPAIFHAAHGSVHFLSLPNFLKNNVIIKEYKIEVSSKLHSELFDDCMELAGESYSIPTLAQILMSDLMFSLFHHDIMPKDLPGYICSELVGKFCIKQLNLKFDKPTYLLTPGDIDDKLNEAYPPAPIISIY